MTSAYVYVFLEVEIREVEVLKFGVGVTECIRTHIDMLASLVCVLCTCKLHGMVDYVNLARVSHDLSLQWRLSHSLESWFKRASDQFR